MAEVERLALTVAEVAARLGMSRKAAYRHLAAGRLPSIKLGRRRLVPVAALARWLAAEEGGHEAKDHLSLRSESGF